MDFLAAGVLVGLALSLILEIIRRTYVLGKRGVTDSIW